MATLHSPIFEVQDKYSVCCWLLKREEVFHWCAMDEIISMVPATFLPFFFRSLLSCSCHIYSFYTLLIETPAEAVKSSNNLFGTWPPGSCFIFGHSWQRGGGKRENKTLGLIIQCTWSAIFNYSKERHWSPRLPGSHAAFSASPWCF